MSGELSEAPEYWFRSSHAELLESQSAALGRSERPPVRTGCDAVLVPSHRHPDRLGFASRLAARLGAALVVLCDARHEAEIIKLLCHGLRQPRAVWVVALEWPASLPSLKLSTLAQPGACSDKHHDVAAKRNLGLALARSVGWHRVLFLDDDVRRITAASVRRACGRLEPGRIQAVSWRLRGFDDNSVVCHARRLAGLSQDVFVGGGALALDVRSDLPLFPPVYNEDWLFLHELVARRAVHVEGAVRQLLFDPFERPERASEEEFGDILAEGLFHLLHEEVEPSVAEQSRYWDGVVAHRREMVAMLREELGQTVMSRFTPDGQRLPPAHRARMERALASLGVAAHEHSGADLADRLASYVKAWRADDLLWRDWFGGLERCGDVGESLRRLGLSGRCLTGGELVAAW